MCVCECVLKHNSTYKKTEMTDRLSNRSRSGKRTDIILRRGPRVPPPTVVPDTPAVSSEPARSRLGKRTDIILRRGPRVPPPRSHYAAYEIEDTLSRRVDMTGVTHTVTLPILFGVEKDVSNEFGQGRADKGRFMHTITINLRQGETLTAARVKVAAEEHMSTIEHYKDTHIAYAGVYGGQGAINNAVPIALTRANLASLSLRGDGFRYIDDVSGKQHKGECMIDALVEGLRGVDDCAKGASRSKVIDFMRRQFGISAPLAGITLEQLAAYLKHSLPRVSLYAIDPSDYVFYSHVSNSHTTHALCLRVNGEHATLLPSSMTASICQHVNDYVKPMDWPNANVAGATPVYIWDLAESVEIGYDARILASYVRLAGIIGPTEGTDPEDQSEVVNYVLHGRTEWFSMSRLISHVSTATGMHMSKVLYSKTGPTGFVHPLTGNTVQYVPDMVAAKRALEILHEVDTTLPREVITYRGQSMSAIAFEYLQSKTGRLPKSSFNAHTRALVTAAKGGALNVKLEDREASTCTGVDVRASYPTVMVNNTDPWPVYTALDMPVKMTCDMLELQTEEEEEDCDRLPIGYYITAKQLVFPFMAFPLQPVLMSRGYTRYAMRRGGISVADLLYWKPSSFLPADVFSDAVQNLMNRFSELDRVTYYDEAGDVILEDWANDLPSRYAKSLLVAVTGMLGIGVSRKNRGALTDSVAIAQELQGRMITESSTQHPLSSYSRANVQELGSLYIVRQCVTTILMSSHELFYQQIVQGSEESGGGLVRLLCEARNMYERGLVPIGFHTDALFVRKHYTATEVGSLPRSEVGMKQEKEGVGPWEPDFTRMLDETTFGGLKLEKGKRLIKTDLDIRFIEDDHRAKHAALPKGFDILASSTIITPEGLLLDKLDSGLQVNGGPGHGKSFLSAKIYHRLVEEGAAPIVMCPLSTTRDQLRAYGMEVETLAYYLQRCLTRPRIVSQIVKCDSVILDEIYQFEVADLTMFLHAKAIKPSLRFYCFGDKHQTRPVTAKPVNAYDYSANAAVAYLCDHRQVFLPYHQGSARYDQPLFDLLDTFRRTGTIDTKEVAVNPPETRENIVMLNDFKRLIDRREMEKHVAQHGSLCAEIPYTGAAMKWKQGITPSIGLPIVCRQNTFAYTIAEGEEKSAKRRVSNGTKYTIQGYANGELLIQAGEEQLRLTTGKLMADFDLDFAISANRSQSITMHGKVTVFIQRNARHMTKAHVLVALSRVTSRDNLLIVCSDKRALTGWVDEPYVHKTLDHELAPIQGAIYGVTNDIDEKLYVGMTVVTGGRTPEEAAGKRLVEHKACKKRKGLSGHIQELGGEHFSTTLLHTAMYADERSLMADETAYIHDHDREKLLNILKLPVPSVGNTGPMAIPTIAVIDANLPTITIGDRETVISYTSGGGRVKAVVSNATKKALYDEEKLAATFAKVKRKFTDSVQPLYTSLASDFLDTTWTKAVRDKRQRTCL